MSERDDLTEQAHHIPAFPNLNIVGTAAEMERLQMFQGKSSIAASLAESSAFYEAADRAGTNDRANVTEGTGEPVRDDERAFSVSATHLARQRDFSLRTFGPGARLAGVLDHIRKELAEVEAEPQDVSEWADVVILAFDGALRQGHEPQAILDAIHAKQVRNEGRRWPDWRTQPLDRAIEHTEEPTA